ncbi:MAG TPA: lactate utilization protein [Clostridia bacterium]|nr:lactate utilization protein [Clostridia bacterium]
MDPIFDLFKTRAATVSAEVYRFAAKAQAVDFICNFVAHETSESNGFALWADCPLLNGFDKSRLCEEVPGLRFNVNRENAAGARIGISQMHWGISNTGTLVQDATAVEQRLVSTLPEIHIAIVATGNILPDLPALLSRVNIKEINYFSFITGPSRTADIERVLTIGVHGPKRLVIVAVDELT